MSLDDLDYLHSALMNGDAVGAVIRTHIHIEKMIYEFCSYHFYDTKYLEKAKLTYNQLCMLLFAFGLKEQYISPLKFLGNYRNNFAHTKKEEITVDDMNNFYQTFHAEDKKIISSTFEKIKPNLDSYPKNVKFKQLEPRDKFTCYALTLRAAIYTALKEIQN